MSSVPKKHQPRQPGKGVWVVALGGALVFGSVAVRDTISKWESGGSATVLTVYADRIAGGIPTVCDGITRHVTRTPIVVGEKWTHQKCERETAAAVHTLQWKLVTCFKRLPPQSVFDMATSHAWNNGVGATCGSAAMRAWNQGDFALGCRRLAFSDGGKRVWSYVKTGRKLANGKAEYKFVPGLANRRDDELRQCRLLNNYKPGPVSWQ